jgi:hypothetical protein
MAREGIEVLIPESTVVIKPSTSLAELARIQRTAVRAPVDPAADETGPLEDPQVLARSRERHVEGLCQLTDHGGAAGQPPQHGSPGAVPEGPEQAVEPFVGW